MKKGFTFFREYRKLLEGLGDKERLLMYEAIFSFFLDDVVVDVGNLGVIFEAIRQYKPPGKTKKKRWTTLKKTIKKVDNYSSYLRSRHWKNFRGYILTLHKRCKICGTTENLEVHHKWYGTRKKSVLYQESDDDVAVLCKKCHDLYHKEYDRATKANFKRFYDKYAKGYVSRIIKRDGTVIDMAKAAEEIKKRNK